MPPTPKGLLRVPLCVALVVPFVLQIFAAVGLTAFLSFKNGQKAVNEVASQLRYEVATRIHQHITDYIKTPQIVTQINADAVRFGGLNLKDVKTIEQHLWHQMQLFKSLNPIGFGTTQGDIYSVGRLNNGSVVIRTKNSAINSNYYTFTTDNKGNRVKLIQVSTTFDPRTRPWYLKAINLRKPVWSKIYPYFSSSGLAISAAQPVYSQTGTLLGVTNATVSLTQLSNFLHNLDIGSSGQTFIIERSGELVASSTAEVPFILTGKNKHKRLNAIASRDRITRLTAKYLQTKYSNFKNINQSQQLDFKIDGKQQFIQIMPFIDDYGLDWVIVVVVSEAEFMEHIEANTRITMLLCLGALTLATVVGVITSQLITQPIMRLSLASEELANAKLDQTIKIEGIDELRTLAQSYNKMAAQLRESFAELLEINRYLEAEIAERKQMEESLRLSEKRFRLAIDNIPHTFVIYDAERRLQFINTFGVRRSGYAKEALLGRRDEEIFPPEVTNTYLPLLKKAVKTRTLQTGECQISLPSGSLILAVTYVPLLNEHGEIHQILGHTYDITERKQAEEQLLQNAFHDALTGLPNRALFMERLKYTLGLAQRQQDYLFAVLFLDLDGFKVINDSFGHLLGDQFLLAIATRLLICLRSTDTAARLGGDEFTILLEKIQNVSEAIKVAERIQQQLALPLELNGQQVLTKASIGIALSSTLDYSQPEDILRDADIAMYRAKALGGARYELFKPDMYTTNQ
ncbi:MAG: diguanylate cyclase [Desmonostoc vinosum HA7617-LM4]|nr:diguanylate cyclase [Desmonostoc vinosum HA7617-LM4]